MRHYPQFLYSQYAINLAVYCRPAKWPLRSLRLMRLVPRFLFRVPALGETRAPPLNRKHPARCPVFYRVPALGENPLVAMPPSHLGQSRLRHPSTVFYRVPAFGVNPLVAPPPSHLRQSRLRHSYFQCAINLAANCRPAKWPLRRCGRCVWFPGFC